MEEWYMTTSAYETSSALLGLSNDLAGAVERAGRSVVAVNARQRVSASGIHWRAGVIVATDHTVERDDEITVTLPDGRSVPATLAGRDPSTDIAVLRLRDADLASAIPAADLGDASSLRVGTLVLAVGRPGDGGLGASMGVISSAGGPWTTYRGGQIDRFVRPDLTLYPGFSGGPLVDAQGLVVGLNTSALSRNQGLTIPVSTINRVVDALLTTGRIARGYLGVGFQPVRLPDTMKASLNLPSNEGVIAVTVEPNGPAEASGMMIGDVLIALDGQPVANTDNIQALLGPERVGKAVAARVVRGGAIADLNVTVGERPQRGE